MIGELFHSVADELFGDDPETRRNGALPYLFGIAVAGGYNALGGRKQIDAPGPLGP